MSAGRGSTTSDVGCSAEEEGFREWPFSPEVSEEIDVLRVSAISARFFYCSTLLCLAFCAAAVVPIALIDAHCLLYRIIFKSLLSLQQQSRLLTVLS